MCLSDDEAPPPRPPLACATEEEVFPRQIREIPLAEESAGSITVVQLYFLRVSDNWYSLRECACYATAAVVRELLGKVAL